MVVARNLFQNKFHVPSLRKSYSCIPDVAALPHLVRIQLDSYEVFKAEGLRELLDEISPIQDFTGNRLEMRSPGVYLTLERDSTSGRDLCYAKLIPNRGAWLEFETSNKNVISVKVDRKRKIPITT